jgi:hypothetical protein
MPVAMRAKLTSRRVVRVGLVASLLVAATLVLSGCWANVQNWGDGTRNITLTENISAQIIWNCTANHGTGAPRAFCALDTVHALCVGKPIKGISESDCNHISSYGDWQDMEQAIVNVTGPRDDCLSFFWENGTYPDDFWGSVFKGFASCK